MTHATPLWYLAFVTSVVRRTTGPEASLTFVEGEDSPEAKKRAPNATSGLFVSL